jgi:pyridoxamine 5'-phosphate oxidase family protein
MSLRVGEPFTAGERGYLANGPRLARVATVDSDGNPHVVPTGWSYDEPSGTIVLRGHALERTKKYRDAQRSGRIALVVDHVDEPWHPVGIEIRGWAEAVGPPDVHIRVHPTRIISWGIESSTIGERFGRDVAASACVGDTPPTSSRAVAGGIARCRRCAETYELTDLSLISLHKTSDGATAYLRCPNGHPLVHVVGPADRSEDVQP